MERSNGQVDDGMSSVETSVGVLTGRIKTIEDTFSECPGRSTGTENIECRSHPVACET